jgi:anti-sigma B factor antagonist
MPLIVHKNRGVTVFTLDATLTYLSGAELIARLDATHDAGVQWLLDMSAVSYIDSAGLGALIHMHQRLAARGGVLKFLHVQPRGRHLLAITGLSGIFESFDTEAAALASFPAAPPAVEGVTQ